MKAFAGTFLFNPMARTIVSLPACVILNPSGGGHGVRLLTRMHRLWFTVPKIFFRLEHCPGL
jgi:hypothetical protein